MFIYPYFSVVSKSSTFSYNLLKMLVRKRPLLLSISRFDPFLCIVRWSGILAEHLDGPHVLSPKSREVGLPLRFRGYNSITIHSDGCAYQNSIGKLYSRSFLSYVTHKKVDSVHALIEMTITKKDI